MRMAYQSLIRSIGRAGIEERFQATGWTGNEN